jgi:hypothetical protein
MTHRKLQVSLKDKITQEFSNTVSHTLSIYSSTQDFTHFPS